MKKPVPISRRKGRPSAGESIRKLENLLEVARQQFSRHGYRAVTMRGVAELSATLEQLARSGELTATLALAAQLGEVYRHTLARLAEIG